MKGDYIRSRNVKKDKCKIVSVRSMHWPVGSKSLGWNDSVINYWLYMSST